MDFDAHKMNARYRIELSQAERGELTTLLSEGRMPARAQFRRFGKLFWPPRSNSHGAVVGEAAFKKRREIQGGGGGHGMAK